MDSSGQPIIENYQRYIPEFNTQTIYALFLIIFGAAIVLGLDWYGKKRNKHI